MSDHDHDHDSHGHGVGHVVSPKILIATALALVVLTIITVVGSNLDFAEFDMPEVNVWLALSIATLKASLVCLFFMHLWWDRAFNAIVLVASVGFVGIFLMFAIIDTREYRTDIIPGDAPLVQDRLAELATIPPEIGHGDDDAAEDEH